MYLCRRAKLPQFQCDVVILMLNNYIVKSTMSEIKLEDEVKVEEKPGSRRKLIQKVRRKVKR